MPELVKPFAEWCAAVIEVVGVGVIILLTAHALAHAVWQAIRGTEGRRVFLDTRQRLARGILVGLELLVAADIIQTVALDLTFRSIGVLAVVVLIRTFLSFTLEVETTGRWPWQAAQPREESS